jgi:HlyD family secretion protein
MVTLVARPVHSLSAAGAEESTHLSPRMFGKKDGVRQAALERLASPGRLDEMMRVTSAAGWTLFFLCTAVIVAVGIWSVVHRIPERVNGQGLLIPGRTRAVEAPVSGIITKIFVRPGQPVQNGEKVVALTVPNAAQELDILNEELANLERDVGSEEKEAAAAKVTRASSHEESKRSYLDQLNRARVGLNKAETRLVKMKAGGFSVAERQGVEAEAKTLEAQIKTFAQNLQTLEKDWFDELFGSNTEARARQERVRAKREQIFRKELERERIIGAEADGRVFDVVVDEGNTVSADQMLVRIEEANQDLQALVYVPSRPGQKVKNGHHAEVFPSNISREDFGGIMAVVAAKNDYPSTKSGIINDIRNETLAEEYTKSGAPLRMELTLQQNPQDPSGYDWTSGPGPATKLIPGTPCEVTLIVDEKRPIDYVVPIFKKH